MMRKGLSLIQVARKSLILNAPAVAAYQQQSIRCDHHGPPANYKYPSMDDLLVPCGSWQENYDNNQRKYNIQLLLGTGFFIITIAVGKYSGALDLYITAPDKPSPPKP